MAVLKEHKKFYDDIFSIEGICNSPTLMWGFQEISKDFDPLKGEVYSYMIYNSFKDYLENEKGVDNITVLDYEDKRADIHFDMNNPFNQNTNHLIAGFKVVWDIGCLEHVFNTAQAMENSMATVSLGGLYVLHTPISGYFNHGFHTFNPKMLIWVLENNGFEIISYQVSTKKGEATHHSPTWGENRDLLAWIVAKRVQKRSGVFYNPIQHRNSIHRSYYEWSKDPENRPMELKYKDPKLSLGDKIMEAMEGAGKVNKFIDEELLTKKS